MGSLKFFLKDKQERNLYIKMYKEGSPSPIPLYAHIKGTHFLYLISAGESHSLYTDHTQTWGWGLGAFGQLGDNTTTIQCTPVAVCGGHTFCHISGGSQHSLAIDNNGQAWSWGLNGARGGFGQLGDGSMIDRSTPVAVYIL